MNNYGIDINKIIIDDGYLFIYIAHYTGCRDCFARIMRQEKYLDADGWVWFEKNKKIL